MKVSRRNFFGFMGGAAAAGPTLAKSLSEEALSQPGPGLGFSGGGLQAAGSNDSWKASRILELRKWISGDRPEAAQERKMALLHSIETRERFRLDCLRSVSPVNRARMFSEGEIERREQIQRLYWERELSDLTGGIL